jgi:hypothetical protein
MMRSQDSAIASTECTSTSLAAAARLADDGPRPDEAHDTGCPVRTSVAPIPAPISPGCRSPMEENVTANPIVGPTGAPEFR